MPAAVLPTDHGPRRLTVKALANYDAMVWTAVGAWSKDDGATACEHENERE